MRRLRYFGLSVELFADRSRETFGRGAHTKQCSQNRCYAHALICSFTLRTWAVSHNQILCHDVSGRCGTRKVWRRPESPSARTGRYSPWRTPRPMEAAGTAAATTTTPPEARGNCRPTAAAKVWVNLNLPTHPRVHVGTGCRDGCGSTRGLSFTTQVGLQSGA